jgi:hypothetical protein
VVRQVIGETKDLIAAGQRRIVLDGVYSWTEYKENLEEDTMYLDSKVISYLGNNMNTKILYANEDYDIKTFIENSIKCIPKFSANC